MDTSKLQMIIAKTGAQIMTDRASTVLTLSSGKVREACNIMVTEMPDFYHLTTITGIDTGNTIELYYHFWKDREFLSIKTSVPKENPVLDSLSDLLPSSLLYEAEVKDLLGVSFKGNPLMDRRLLLPDDYPSTAPPPLRKEAKADEIRKMMELE